MSHSNNPAHFPITLLHPYHWPTWIGVGILCLCAYLPITLRHQLGKQIGKRLYQYHNKRRHIVLTNMRLCFPNLSTEQHEQYAKQHLQQYTCALLDYSILFFRHRQYLYQYCQLSSSSSFQQAIKEKKPIILFLGHSVWLEFAPLILGKYFNCYGSYKPFKNPVFDWLIARSRLRDVEFVISRDEGMLRLVRAMSDKRMMIFLPDEDHGEAVSVYAPFMGHIKATLNTPPRLAKLTKAYCFPVMVFFNAKSKKYQTVIGDKLSDYPSNHAVQDASQLNAALARLIETQPTQYMWLLKLFKTQPNQEKYY